MRFARVCRVDDRHAALCGGTPLMGRDITNVAASVRQRLLNHRTRVQPAVQRSPAALRHGALPVPACRVATPRSFRAQGSADDDGLGGAGLAADDGHRPPRVRSTTRSTSSRPVAREVCEQQVAPDGMAFDAKPRSRRSRIAEDAEYEGVRVRFRGTLGTARVSMQLDIGFGDAVIPNPVLSDYPAILDLPAPRVRGYTRESAVAEKLPRHGQARSAQQPDAGLLRSLAAVSGSSSFEGAFAGRGDPGDLRSP
jgi:hypothetical protein